MLVNRHRDEDCSTAEASRREKEERAIENLQSKAKKIRIWLEENDERIGARGKPVKSNITDNESAKMPSSHGVIQGYNGIATVDDKHQVIVDAQAFGDGHEAKHLEAVVDSVQDTFCTLDEKDDVYEEVVLTADSGFHSEESVKKLLERGVEAYVADNRFRQRDPRFAEQQEHKKKSIDRKRIPRARKYFSADEFHFDKSTGKFICPAGKPMKSKCPNWRDKKKGYTGKTYMGFEENCSRCKLKAKCIRNSVTKARQVTKIAQGVRHQEKSAVQQMIERFDSINGRFYYSEGWARSSRCLPISGTLWEWIVSASGAERRSTYSGSCSVWYITLERS